MPDVLDSGFLIFIIGPLAYMVLFVLLWRKKQGVWRIMFHSILLLYLLGVVNVTLFPVVVAPDIIMEQRQAAQLHNNFMPLASIFEILRERRWYVILPQIGGNILLAMPLGFLLPLMWQGFRAVKPAILVGVLFTVAIEASQFLISAAYGYTYKITDVDDILLNTFGFIVGFFLFRAAWPLLEAVVPDLRRQKRRRRVAA